MPRTKVESSQFECSETEVVHKPTGATFIWYPN